MTHRKLANYSAYVIPAQWVVGNPSLAKIMFHGLRTLWLGKKWRHARLLATDADLYLKSQPLALGSFPRSVVTADIPV